jgi:hypothetical protein
MIATLTLSLLLSAESVEDACKRTASVAYPASDNVSDAEAKTLKGCNSEALYYGIGMGRDSVKARKCAYVEIASKEEPVFGGALLLMVIYGTGDGAALNTDLAIHLACENSHADAEKDARVQFLLERKSDPAKANAPFDICDHITSGFMSGHCAAHSQRIASVARAKRLAVAETLVRALAEPEYAALQKARDVFFKAREENEVDLSGSARAAFMVEERACLDVGFVEALEKLAKSEAPVGSDFAAADKTLNAAYSKLMKSDFDYGTVTKESIKKTQRLWLKYRDAWAALGSKRNAGDAWKTWATTQRTAQLLAFIE